MPSSPITSIRELLHELLRHGDASTFASILSRYSIPSHDLEPYFRWNSRHYTRTCIHRNEDLELLVICYEPGQSTSIHDYNSQTAWIHPILGEVVEERYTARSGGELRSVQQLHLNLGTDVSRTNGSSIHRFTNYGAERAATLNLYAKPVSKWRIYDERTGGSRLVPAGPPA